jgi:hypothetical protein
MCVKLVRKSSFFLLLPPFFLLSSHFFSPFHTSSLYSFIVIVVWVWCCHWSYFNFIPGRLNETWKFFPVTNSTDYFPNLVSRYVQCLPVERSACHSGISLRRISIKFGTRRSASLTDVVFHSPSKQMAGYNGELGHCPFLLRVLEFILH